MSSPPSSKLLQVEPLLRIYLVIGAAPGIINSAAETSSGDPIDHLAAYSPDWRDDSFVLPVVLSGSSLA